MTAPGRKDLLALVADAQQEATLRTLLTQRCPSLRIRPPTFDIYRHPRKDPGVFRQAADFLAPYLPPAYAHALVLLDAAWEGAPGDADMLRADLLRRLHLKGWPADRCQVVVIAPELEAWAWANSPAVPEVLRTSWADIRALADGHGGWSQGRAKPNDPKALLEAVLRQQGRPRSAAVFQELADRVGLAACTDPAFVLLRETLVGWFGTHG
jgi:hypothetical protein